MNTDTPETDEACGYASNWDRLNNRLRDEVPAEFARKLERERDEAREEWGKASMDAAQLLSEKTYVIAERDEARAEAVSYEAMLNIARENADELREEVNQWKNGLKLLGDTPEKVWDAWRKRVIKTQKYIREMVYWRDKCKQSDPTTTVEEAKDILNSYR